MWKCIVAAALAAGILAGPASAATYRLELFVGTADNPFGDGVPDWFGRFTAEPPNPISPFLTASIRVAGVLYDQLNTFGPYFDSATWPNDAPTIDGIVESGPIPDFPATVASIGFSPSSNSVTRQFWYLTQCALVPGGEVECSETPPDAGGQSGGFRVSQVAPVPLPAAGLLLAGGLGALAALRRRRVRTGGPA